jgi:hypothetical protein
MKKYYCVILLAAVLGLLVLAGQDLWIPKAMADANVIIKQEEGKVLAHDFSIYVPCANGGNGENVVIKDYLLQYVNRLMVFSSGRYHESMRAHPIGAIAVGEVTGDVYRCTGGNGLELNGDYDTFPFIGTQYIEIQFISQGSGVNFRIHINLHWTVNANGETTVRFVNDREECG